MCGIAGKVYSDGQKQVDPALLDAMGQAMAYRGPDDEGQYLAGNVGLCMRRLQVIDLASGKQPMTNEDGSLQIVFNGEIYNYLELRRRLETNGHVLRTASDTETILHLYEEKGLDFVEDLRGMFAVAIWDEREKMLVLARDRLGQKPLHYTIAAGAITFASEIATLLCDTEVERVIDPQAVDEYLTYLFVPHPRTIYRNIYKLAPASCAVFKNGELQIERYWSVQYGQSDKTVSRAAAQDELDDLLRQSIQMRLLADVPVGAFLSGGLDSSLVVAMMQQMSAQPVRTFAIGFEESSFNELDAARHIAQVIGTEHQEYRVTYEIKELLPKLLDHFAEPFADSSAIPVFHLSRVTRENVTVALSGDGGDEVFGGYRRYRARLLADRYDRIPDMLGRGLVDWLAGRMSEPATYYGTSVVKKLKRFVEFARTVRQSPETSWAFFFTHEEKLSLYSEKFADILYQEVGIPSLHGYFTQQFEAGRQHMLWVDLMTYLPDDILAKVDRMSMACSLEVRCPFLDHRVVEFMAQMPIEYKYNQRQTKILLRDVAQRYLPAAVLQRPKQGFAIPLASWLKNELRPWMEDTLLSSSAIFQDLFDRRVVEGMIAQHLQGRRDLSQQLWALIVLEVWLKKTSKYSVSL